MQNKPISTQETTAPLISFIIPYYNLPMSMLKECIDSIRQLSLRPSEREIILVDDGSERSPLSELGYCLDELVCIRQKNGGLSAARNTGMRMATGTYVQFVDADDRLAHVAYEHCLDIVRFNAPDMLLFRHADTPQESVAFDDTEPMSGTEYMRTHNIQGSAWGYLFNKRILGNLRFTRGIYHEDEEFTPLLMLRADTVMATNAEAYIYMQRPDSIITSIGIRHRLRRINDTKGVLLRLNRLADTLPVESRMALERRVHQLTMDFIYNVIVLTRSQHYLERQLKELQLAGLYPLPDRKYTRKYDWFRRLVNHPMGLRMLMRAIPMMKKPR